MSTVVGIRCRDGVVLGGDRRLVRGGRVVSNDRRHVFGVVDGVGVAAVGRDVDRFVDRFTAELKRYLLERDALTFAVVERTASDVAAETGTEALVAARDEGTATLSAVHADGSTLTDPVAAFGSGAALALGRLEAREDCAVADADALVADVFAAVSERDPSTGEETDVWSLSDSSDANSNSNSPD